MSDSPAPRRTRVRGAVIVAVLLVVLVAVAVVGLVTGGAFSPQPAGTSTPLASATAAPSVTQSAAATPSAKATASAKPSTKSKAAAATTPRPQPTKTAAIASAAPIVKELTAKVSKIEAVQGKAQGPGEIAGPAVRFTIRITNATGKTVDLSNTVVNAYYGSASTPAVELQEPGGKPFPSKVANGGTATGVFVFTIKRSDRSRVSVTVDTSVKNPVVAFRGSATE